jgi:hypothetical protein
MTGPSLNPGLQIADWSRSGFRLYEDSLGIGDTFENDKWRVHRYAGSLVMTDLTNAGKRGKKVDEIAFYNLDMRTAPSFDLVGEMIGLVKSNASLDKVKKAAEDFKDRGYSLEVRVQRGVDVMPGGFKPIRINTDNLYIEAGYDSFTVRDKRDQYNDPTCIPASKGGKKSIPAFYRWVKDNERKIQSMTYSDVTKAMRDMDLAYHSYCAVD